MPAITAGGILAGFIALFLVGLALGYPKYCKAQRDQDRPTSAYEAPQNIQSDLSPAERIARALEAANDANNSVEKTSHDKGDLAAQQDMACWAFWMMIAAYVQALVGLAGFGFLYWGITETRKANQIAFDGLADERKARQIELRAYITVATGGCVPQDNRTGWRFEVRPHIINTGSTPAYNVRFSCNAEIFPFPIPDDVDLTLPIPDGDGRGVIGAGQGNYLRGTLNRMIDAEEINMISGHVVIEEQRRLYVYGTILYDDAFGAPHYTNFCQWSMWTRNGDHHGTNAHRHNDCDQPDHKSKRVGAVNH